MLRSTAMPQAIMDLSQKFDASPFGQERLQRTPKPLGDLAWRTLNLKIAYKNGHFTEPIAIHATAQALETDLMAWKAALPSWCDYIVIDDSAIAKKKESGKESSPSSSCTSSSSSESQSSAYPDSEASSFQGKRHIYPDPHVCRLWNGWRTLRIVVAKIKYQNMLGSSELVLIEHAERSRLVAMIRRLSTDICIAAPGFTDSPRMSYHSLSLFYFPLDSWSNDVPCKQHELIFG